MTTRDTVKPNFPKDGDEWQNTKTGHTLLFDDELQRWRVKQ